MTVKKQSTPKMATPKVRRERTDDELERDREWGTKAARIVKAAMARQGLNAVDLAEILTESGRPTTPQALRNLLSAGKFRAGWFLDVLTILGETDITIEIGEIAVKSRRKGKRAAVRPE